ncbi:MAG: glycosyltransferase family 4 protein [Patescibacteria group bacterium]
MKIAFLSFYSGSVDRGVETATLALAGGLSKNHQVTVYHAGDRISSQVNTVKLKLGVDWEKKDASGTLLRRFYLDYWSRKITEFTVKLLPNLLKEKYDVVIPANGGWQVILCRLASWLVGTKILVQGNAGIGQDDLFQLYCFPDIYIAISPQGFLWANKFASWIKKKYVPYGVDLPLFKFAKPRAISLRKPIVLCVAAFSPYKQIELLLKAMEKVENASLLLVGQGILKEELKNLGEKLLGNRFMLKTGVKHDELPGYYKTANAFSMPSAGSEAFGIVYVEALAAGLPVVAPDDYNRHEIIGDAGIFVDPQNTDEYARAIALVLTKNFENKPELQARKFDWKNIVRQYEEILDSL